MKTLQTNRDLAVQIFKILYARSDGTPEGILLEFHKTFVKSKQLSNQDFKETDHPRDDAGKFTDKGESSESDVTTKTEKRTSQKTIAELLGTEHKGVKGKEAIDLLMKEKSGWVADAFTYKNLNISLIWGDENIGLKQLLKEDVKQTNHLENY